MSGADGHGFAARLDWDRVETWSRQLAETDLSEISAAFEASGTSGPRLLWRPKRFQVQTSYLRFILDYWNGLKRGAPLPRYSSVDLRALSPVLGYESLVDVMGQGRDFRYARCSAAMGAFLGYDMTDRPVSEHSGPPHVVASVLALYRATFRRGEPVYTERTLAGATAHAWLRLILPLADEAGKVSGFLGGTVPLGPGGLPI
jgi:hypothetical protein